LLENSSKAPQGNQMKLAELIRADKTKVNLGSWATGHIPGRRFPSLK
jgi:hypothetical protein